MNYTTYGTYVYNHTARMYCNEKCTALNYKHDYHPQYNSLQSTCNTKLF